MVCNEIILSDELTIDSIQNIIESVIDIDPNRNDSIIVKSYRFTNHRYLFASINGNIGQKIYPLVLISILGVIANKFFEKYKKHQQKIAKQKNDNSQKKEKLAKIIEEEEEKTFTKLNEILLKHA